MKAFLMHPDQDFDLERALPANEDALTQDLELTTLFEAMAGDDRVMFDVVKRAVLVNLTDADTIVYRQQVLRDCLEQPPTVREIYQIAVEAIEGEKKVYWGFLRDSPETILHRSVQVLELFLSLLKRLRQVTDAHANGFRSEGFVRFFTMLEKELDDEYLQTVESHLRELKFRHGVLISVELGAGNKGAHHILRRPREQSWMQRLSLGNRSSYSFTIADRDDSGFKALSELQGRGINEVANALAQSTDHILSFFRMLRCELAFYVGCLNVYSQLLEKGEGACFPVPVPPAEPAFHACGLYDVSLALSVPAKVVGNDVDADNKWLVMITGANQGGKSTFLRSAGQAQLMMQAGMFVPAESFRANVCEGVFTHYKREEDTTMTSGKLDEELSRMSDIADMITPSSLFLSNESFASTNEREGSEIARQIIYALLERRIKVFFVTHLFDLARSFSLRNTGTTLFLRAERQSDGRRTFKLLAGDPLPTSYGEDLYQRIFNTTPDAVAAGTPPD